MGLGNGFGVYGLGFRQRFRVQLLGVQGLRILELRVSRVVR